MKRFFDVVFTRKDDQGVLIRSLKLGRILCKPEDLQGIAFARASQLGQDIAAPGCGLIVHDAGGLR